MHEKDPDCEEGGSFEPRRHSPDQLHPAFNLITSQRCPGAHPADQSKPDRTSDGLQVKLGHLDVQERRWCPFLAVGGEHTYHRHIAQRVLREPRTADSLMTALHGLRSVVGRSVIVSITRRGRVLAPSGPGRRGRSPRWPHPRSAHAPSRTGRPGT